MKELTNIFKALSDETRLRILKLLEHGELCVCDVVAALDMVQPQVSFHLRILKEAGILKGRKEGKWIHYRIDDTDIFKRLLILSIFERIPKELLNEDIKRLDSFLKRKAEGSLDNKEACNSCVKRLRGERQHERHI